MAILNTKFEAYFSEFEKKFTATDSAYAKMFTDLKQSFDSFGLSAEQSAELLVNAHISALNSIQSNANNAALSLIAEEKKQELTDANISLANANKLLADANKSLISAQEAKVLKDIELVDKNIAHTNEMINTQVEATRKMAEDVFTQIQQADKIIKETEKIDRDIKGYADQMHIKACEYKSSLASFAVNAGGDEAQMQAAIDAFNNQVTTMLGRANP